MLLWVLLSLLVLFSTIDFWYFVRGAWAVLKYLFQAPIRDVLAEQVVQGRVLPHDIDYMGHMNNSRYLRECDFARLSYYTRNGMYKAYHTLGARMVVGALTIRYRRSLELGEAFELRSRILAWDEKSFFMEQRFVSKSDGFISAVLLCRQNITRSTPEEVLQHICKRKVNPDSSQSVQTFVRSQVRSSRNMSGFLFV